VYIEVRGALYVIVTEKRITLASLNGSNSVKIKTGFKFVQCGEYTAAKLVFRGEEINKISSAAYLPVLGKDVQLLGEYSKDKVFFPSLR